MPSSVVAHIYYNEETSVLRVTYQSGSVYDYKDVPLREYKHMKAAVSKGKYLNERIKGHYAFEKIN